MPQSLLYVSLLRRFRTRQKTPHERLECPRQIGSLHGHAPAAARCSASPVSAMGVVAIFGVLGNAGMSNLYLN